MHVKPPVICTFWYLRGQKKWGDGRAVVLGVGFFVGFFWPPPAWDQQYFTYWRLIEALNCLLHTIWHGKAAGQTLSNVVFQWIETRLIYSCSGFGSFLCLCKITWRLPSLMLKSTAISLGIRAPLRYCSHLGSGFQALSGLLLGEQVMSVSK